MSLAVLLNRFQHWLARRPVAVALCQKIINQCRLVVGYHLGPTSDARANGELLVLETVASHTRFFVDVGANAGAWTHCLLERLPPGREPCGILAEPARDLANQLRGRFALHGGLQIVEAAVGEKAGAATFYLSPTCSEHSSLHMPAASPGVPVEVKVVTLDGLMTDIGRGEIDIVKIDTEGNDFNVLLGAEILLSRQAAHVIQFEYGQGWRLAGHTLCAAFRFLRKHGYECLLITGEGLCSYDPDRFGEHFMYSNFLAVSETGKGWVHGLLR